MEKELIKAFHNNIESCPALASNIWQKITVRNKKIILFKLYTLSFVGFTSLVGLIPVGKMLFNDLAQSGFYEYISLAFSNGTSVFSYWKELTFSIAESLPTASIILSLSLVLILFLSLKYTAKQIIKGQLSLSF